MDIEMDRLADLIDYRHTTDRFARTMPFHLHELYEIYFFISGNVRYFIEKSVYDLQYGNLMVMNGHEIHRFIAKDDQPYERIVIHFPAFIAKMFSGAGYDLRRCFENRDSGRSNRIALNEDRINTLIDLFRRMETHHKNASFSSIMKCTAFIELLARINDWFIDQNHKTEVDLIPSKLKPILAYIDANPDHDLRLAKLEELFFINRFHLSKMFKNAVGSTLHEYIVYKRIALAKTLLLQGLNVTETCNRSGFNDYSHFLRSFKKTVGLPPGRYQKEYLR